MGQGEQSQVDQEERQGGVGSLTSTRDSLPVESTLEGLGCADSERDEVGQIGREKVEGIERIEGNERVTHGGEEGAGGAGGKSGGER